MANWTTVVSRAVKAVALADTERLSDRELLQRFASQDDQVAFGALVKRHGPMVLGVCGRTLPRSQDAEDATQAVFVLLARKAKSTIWQTSVANWLYTTARRVARNARIASERRTRREGQVKVPETPSPLDAMTGRELLAALDEELDKLLPRYREPLVLCHLEGLSREEAATRLGVPAATLKSQLERGRKKLADALTARGCTLNSLLLLVTAARCDAASRLIDSILASVSGPPSEAVAALVQGATMKGIFAKTNLLAILGVGVALIGLGLASVPLTSAQQQKVEPPKQEEKKVEAVTVEIGENEPIARIGSNRFRADETIGDARYSADGKRIVAHAGMTLYVWDAKDGTLLRKIDTKLGRLTNPEIETYGETKFGFAVHPNANRIAWCGIREGKTYLQIWDFETGERLHECETALPTLLALAWTPDGKHLLERSYSGRGIVWMLVVRDEKLKAVHSHKLREQFHQYGRPLLPHPNGKQVLLWQSKEAVDVLDIETGATVRTIGFNPSIASDLGISPDGKTCIATGTNEMWLFDFATGEKLRELPVLRGGAEKPHPLFSKDGKTVYVWDHQPMAYEVETAKRKWKASSPTYYGVGMGLRDLSPDGATLLTRVGHAIVLIDAKTGIERDIPKSPSGSAQIFWSPDSKTILTRDHAYGRNRTFTAWDVATGKRLYHVHPGEGFQDDDWKTAPDLFFLNGGKEFLVCVEKAASHEKSAFKELVIVETTTGRVKRKLGGELGEKFRWMHPTAANEDGSRVVLQAYAVSMGKETEYATLLWDTEKQTPVREWTCSGERFDTPRRFAPYRLFLDRIAPVTELEGRGKVQPARLRLYSLADGKEAYRLESEFTSLDADRVQAGFLLTSGYNGGWKTYGNTSRYEPITAHTHELWELATGEKMRLFETPKPSEVALGPGAKYLIRPASDRGFEVYEPYVLKKPILTVELAGRASQFEFSADGTRVAASLADTTIAIWDTTPWVKQIDDELRQCVPQDLNSLWEDLAKETGAALPAARLLNVAGERVVALLGEKLAPKRVPEEAAVRKLIRDLDAAEFAARQKAEKQLRGFSGQIEPHLRAALKDNPSAEAKKRVEELLKAIESGKLSGEECREVRAVTILKAVGSKEAKELLAKWSNGDPKAILTKAARE